MNQQQEKSEFVRENGYGRFWDSSDCQPEQQKGVNQSEIERLAHAQSYSAGYNEGVKDAMILVRHSETRANQLINSLYHQVAQLEKTVKHAVAMIKYGVSEHHPMVLDLEFEGACRQFLSQHGGA